MKKLVYFACTLMMLFVVASCNNNKKVEPVMSTEDSLAVVDPDSTLYGVCGEGTSMHSIELVMDDGKVVNLLVGIDDESEDPVKGGLLNGDRLAVVMSVQDGDTIAKKVINLTTLEGKWTSLDRNFEIVQGGEILSTVQSESDPYTSWKIHNGQLLMGRDSFDVLTLGADSLEIENSKGIFVYKRQK